MKLGELLKKRETLEKQSVERQLADVNAQIARAEADEATQVSAEQDAVQAAALADARAKRDAAEGQVEDALLAMTAALGVLGVHEARLRELGDTWPEKQSVATAALRQALHVALVWRDTRAEWAAKAAIPPEVQRRKMLEGALERAEHCFAVAKESGRDDLIRNAKSTLRDARERLGMRVDTPDEGALPQPVNRAAIADATAMAHHDYYAAMAKDLRAKEAAKVAGDAQAQN